uniref:Uncharacterized protein n=1 Tax=Anguilla anguilla TaxID=7936 RepID=A0A0E9PJ15_ANGAN
MNEHTLPITISPSVPHARFHAVQSISARGNAKKREKLPGWL